MLIMTSSSKIMRNFIISLLALLAFASCGEYTRVQKSTDNDYKLDFAKRAFEQKKYVQAATILTDVVTVFKGTQKAEDALYLLALSHYENKDYTNSGAYFKTYYTRYPKGKYTELARFYCGYGYYLHSFLPYFPHSDKVGIAQNAIFELQDKLTLKELQNAQLYYNLGNYMGNNYESAVIVAKNAIKTYPYSRYKEDLELLVLKARYQEASQSVEEKKSDRFRTVVDEYYSFINNYPDSPNRREAENIFKIAQSHIKD